MEGVLPSTYDMQDCALARALEVLGERWTLLVMRDAFYGVRRFNDFLGHLDVPRTVLSTRLRALVGAGLMERVPDPGHRGRYLYELTDSGRALWPALYALRAWGEQFASGNGTLRRTFVHDACGNQLSHTAHCQACGVIPEPAHVVVTPAGQPGPNSRRDPVALGLMKPHRLLDGLP
jgi:DNA-binding HxlR family transcriptional regulator